MITKNQTGFLRLPHIIGDSDATPPIPPIFPISKSSWYAGIKSGKYPAPVKLSERTSAWRIEDILELVEKLGGQK